METPSLEFVQDVEAHLGQAILDGAQSIEDPAYKGGGLPFWTIRYWKEMHVVSQAQARWKKVIYGCRNVASGPVRSQTLIKLKSTCHNYLGKH